MVNWTSYNESLVRRGKVILDFDIIDGWYVELERMNEGKRGATYGDVAQEVIYDFSEVQVRITRIKTG